MVSSKLKRHLTLKHNHLANKPRSYFEGLLSEHKQQSAMLSKKVKVADKAQEASYLVEELVVKSMKPHTIAETLILPACSAIVKTLFGSEAEKEVRKIPVSDSTISRRIHMRADMEETVCTSVKESEMFALQVDESTDIGGMVQLIVFVRYIHDVRIVKQFFCCKELKETTTGNDIFSTFSEYLKSVCLTWQSCVGICTDGAPAMIGSIKGFVSLVKRENSSVITTYCFLHRKALVAKTISNDLKSVLEKVVTTDKIKVLKEKLQLWGGKVKEGNLDMFSHVAVAANSGEIIPIISEHLAVLEKQLQHYFPDICTENYDWIRNPFVASISTQSQLTLMEDEQLVEVRHDRELKLFHMQLPLNEFWVHIKTKYPHVAKKALVMLIHFSTSYQRELGFSTLANITTNKR
ncbi:SCAN domain-containing protein 3-like [Palaemon carinicauda]|uniref:SCAN domain-containing protein 3-like n=1 Tax=Palaemon carinicauda TaxID=392227 RepID=UPI0035B57778